MTQAETCNMPHQQTPIQDVPMNLYRQTEPLKATCVENTRLTPEGSPNDVRHVVFSLESAQEGPNYRYLDGQSAGILPPGTTAEGKNHKLRLYSIASPGYGDDGEGKTLSLCVKRVLFNDPVTGEEVKGVCSNHICDLKPGDTVDMTGPVGKSFLLPEAENANVIMFATGTGIAPFRGFLKHRYEKRAHENGQYWLFFGVQKSVDLLYHDWLKSVASEHSDFHLKTALSREEQTADGQKMYIQNRLMEYRKEVLELLQQPNTYLYMCGLKGMEGGISEAIQKACEETGVDWPELYGKLKAAKRWHVEVY